MIEFGADVIQLGPYEPPNTSNYIYMMLTAQQKWCDIQISIDLILIFFIPYK